MAKGIFIGLPLADVQAIQSAAVAQLKEGKTVMEYTVGEGIRVSKDRPMSMAIVLDECAYAINRLNGTILPRRTVSDFSGVNR